MDLRCRDAYCFEMKVILLLCDTLRRDHVGAYHRGRRLNECGSMEAPDWIVPTPNLDRLAARGTVFDNCYHGSTPCMPARRDILTGRLEFLERGWGPLEETDLDLPTLISGPNNQSIQWMKNHGHTVSCLLTDHFHLWERGAGNYHMGFTGFEFIRGLEADNWQTHGFDFECPPQDRDTKLERHFRNLAHLRETGGKPPTVELFECASRWLDRNHKTEDFFLYIDCFNPHEPLDPPEDFLEPYLCESERNPKMETSFWPYEKWRGRMTEKIFRGYRARYAAKVAWVDHCLGKLLDTMDEQNLWDDTLFILTTDHGTFNGDHGRLGKMQTHEFDALSHLPMILVHPTLGKGERRKQLVQLVDLYPTILTALGKMIPENIHGKNLIPVLENSLASTRKHAIYGSFGKSVSITDGEWVLHQNPLAPNQPLFWYGHHLARFLKYELGDFEKGKRRVKNLSPWYDPTWLSDKQKDPSEVLNLCEHFPEKAVELRNELKKILLTLPLPGQAGREQCARLGI